MWVNPFDCLTYGLLYVLVLGSPFILACLLIWYLIRRVDRGKRQRGFDVMGAAERNASDDRAIL